MKLYPKKLKSVEDLKREKKILLKEAKQLDKEDMFSVKDLLGRNGKKQKDDDDDAGSSWLDLLPISNPIVGQLAGWALGRLMKKKEADKEDWPTEPDHKKKSKGMLRKAAVELIGGYLKWKAVELSYKGVKLIIKKRKEKKEAEGRETN